MVLVYSSDYDNHQDPQHIENKSRTDAIIHKLSQTGFLDYTPIIEPQSASPENILRVHTPHHVKYIKDFCNRGGGYIDYDTYASSLSYKTALLAAGGAITSSKLVADGEKWAYSIARPPGHHATRERAMGFCLFNNAAVAVEYLKEEFGLKRFLIIDFDVHYGNGDADIFYHDPNVLYISIHQDPRTIFPGKGFIHEQGTGKGKGYNLNIPMPPGSQNTDYIWILKELLEPLIKEFKPQIVFAEAGFDAHQKDILSRISLTEDFYAWIGEYLMELTGSLVVLLEGGYNLEALGNSNLHFITALDRELFTSLPLKNKNDKDREKIENEYLKKNKVSSPVNQIYREIKDNFSPFFKF